MTITFDHGRALIIGVGSYRFVQRLNIPVSVEDARQVQAVLADQELCGYPPEQVTLLHDESAGRAGILAALDELAQSAPEDTVFIYYSGHGANGTDRNYYLTAYDTRILGGQVVSESGISEFDLLTRLKAIPAKRLIFFFNACYSGKVSPHLGVEEEEFEPANLPNGTADAILSSGEGRIIITASREDQESWIGKGRLSLFAQALVDGLNGRGWVKNRRGYIGAFGLYEYIFETVKEAAGDLGRTQEPELTVLKGVGPFPLALYLGAKSLGMADEQESLANDLAVRRVSPKASQGHFERVIQTGGSYVEGDVEVHNGDFVGRNKISLQAGATYIEHAIINQESTPNPTTDAISLREAYLNTVFETCGILSLSGIDRKAASESQPNLDLSAVYTALLTQTREEVEKTQKGLADASGERDAQRYSALEMLNRSDRLVLLGDPGSGKSTFVSFVALCLAGEGLGRDDANLALLRTPLPTEDEAQNEDNRKKPKPQPWKSGPLLPVRIILRDLAARGLPGPEESAGVEDLWRFIDSELEKPGLRKFTPLLRKELLEKGGLVMFDGLDEVPEASQRRAQIKAIVEGFATSNRKCRVLVTSRIYAYEKQEWKLAHFTSTVLAPFSRAQIAQFIQRWYRHIAVLRKLNGEEAQGRAALLRQAVLNSERLMGLAERPLLLTLMASLHAWRGGALPEKREELYSDAVDLLLDWWESQRVVRGPKGDFILVQPSLVEWLKIKDRQQVRDLLNRLAFEAHRRQPDLNGTADVPETDLIAGLFKIGDHDGTDTRELRNFLSQRTGLLLPRGEGVYTYPHRTFQEYLAVCFLTDHDYPEQVAELACADYERWREVALLAAAKAARGAASTLWSLVNALCFKEINNSSGQDFAAQWGAHLAGQALVENANLQAVSERNQPKLEQVRSWLVHILKKGELPARERVLAGDNLSRLGDPRFDPLLFNLPKEELLGFVEIPNGSFLMGSDPKQDKNSYKDERPQHKLSLSTFYLARYPVTVAQFRTFVDASDYKPRDPDCLRGEANHPVVWVTWNDALAYCRWLNEALHRSSRISPMLKVLLENRFKITLPSEAEWEKAVRYIPEDAEHTSHIYAWGDVFDPDKANTSEGGSNGTSPVGSYPKGASGAGLLDMCGNVWEWTRSIEKAYPYSLSDDRENLKSDQNRILRGGSWGDYQNGARCASWGRYDPGFRLISVGFRISLSQPS